MSPRCPRLDFTKVYSPDVFQHYVEAAQDRRHQLEARITETIPNRRSHRWLTLYGHRVGLDLISVVIFVAAINDLGRFSMSGQLMAYLG
jgi:hypothetical protein